MASETDVIDLTEDPPPSSCLNIAPDEEPSKKLELVCIVISDDDDDECIAVDPPPKCRPVKPSHECISSDSFHDVESDSLNRIYPNNDDDDGGHIPEQDESLSETADETPRSQSKKRQVHQPSYQQTGEQPLMKKLFRGSPRWNPARNPTARTEERPLPNCEYRAADKAPVWIKNVTPIASRKARRQQFRTA